MKNSNDLKELEKNCTQNAATLLDLFKTADLAKIGREMMDSEFRDIDNAILSEIEFYTKKDYTPRWPNEPGPGERVTDAEWLFLTEDSEYKRFMKISAKRYTAAGLTDKAGNYTTKWPEIEAKANRALWDFIILHIVPESMRQTFWTNRLNITQMQKLADITRARFMNK